MALSVNNKYLALYADTGLVWIGSSNLKVSYIVNGFRGLVKFARHLNFIFQIFGKVLFVSKCFWVFFLYCRLFTVNLTLDRRPVPNSLHGKQN